jgi:hypothetical protein
VYFDASHQTQKKEKALLIILNKRLISPSSACSPVAPCSSSQSVSLFIYHEALFACLQVSNVSHALVYRLVIDLIFDDCALFISLYTSKKK